MSRALRRVERRHGARTREGWWRWGLRALLLLSLSTSLAWGTALLVVWVGTMPVPLWAYVACLGVVYAIVAVVASPRGWWLARRLTPYGRRVTTELIGEVLRRRERSRDDTKK